MKWTDEEHEIMRLHYKTHYSDGWMVKWLGGRNPKAIREKARSMGLTESWTPAMEKILLDRYPEEGSTRELAKEIGVTRHALTHKALCLGVAYNHRHASGPKNKTYKGHEGMSGTFWYQICKSAIVRGIPIQITIQDAWDLYVKQKGLCALTGEPLLFALDTHHRATSNLSLDRKDSKLPYTKENVQWVCKPINRMKQGYSQDKFVEWCRRVTSHHDKQGHKFVNATPVEMVNW